MKWLVVVAVGISLTGCARGCKRPLAGVRSDDVAQPGSGADDQPRVTFVIDALYDNHQPAKRAPWHEPGGTWKFFDAHVEDGTKFVFGWKGSSGDHPVSFSSALWAVSDSRAGAQLVQRFAKVFGGELPPSPPSRWRWPSSVALLRAAGAAASRERETGSPSSCSCSVPASRPKCS